jgi:uncharacterized peroxidase-related enzyme
VAPFLARESRHTRLPYREREIIATVISGANRCAYCIAHHARLLGQLARDESLGHRVAADHRHVAELSPREHALADIALEVNRDPASITEADLDGLRTHGLDDHAILEAISIAAIIGATSRISSALAVPPDPEWGTEGPS